MTTLSRQELIGMVMRIMEADGAEDEIDRMITLLEQNVPHPAVCDLIFHPDHEMTAEEIVDAAMAYTPIRL